MRTSILYIILLFTSNGEPVNVRVSVCVCVRVREKMKLKKEL